MVNISFQAKYLLMYLLTSPHRNILCFYFLPKAYACFDMGISSEAFDAAMKELIEADRILYDFNTHVVCVKNFLKYNALDNVNKIKSAIAKVSEIPKNSLFHVFAKHLETLKKTSYQPLIDELYKRSGKPSPEPLSQPLPETLPETLANPCETLAEPFANPCETLAEPFANKETEHRIKKQNKRAKRAKRAPARSTSDPDVSRVFEKFSRVIHPVSGQFEQDGLLDLLDTYGVVWVEQAIGNAKGGKTVQYIAAILQRWKSTGLPEPWKKNQPAAGKGVLDIIDEMQRGDTPHGDGV